MYCVFHQCRYVSSRPRAHSHTFPPPLWAGAQCAEARPCRRLSGATREESALSEDITAREKAKLDVNAFPEGCSCLPLPAGGLREQCLAMLGVHTQPCNQNHSRGEELTNAFASPRTALPNLLTWPCARRTRRRRRKPSRPSAAGRALAGRGAPPPRPAAAAGGRGAGPRRARTPCARLACGRAWKAGVLRWAACVKRSEIW